MQRDLFIGEAQLFHTPQNFRIQLGILLLLRLQPILALQQLRMSYYIGKLVQEPLVNACHLAYLLGTNYFRLERRGKHKYATIGWIAQSALEIRLTIDGKNVRSYARQRITSGFAS
jgi:hypothetical protein